MLHAFFLLTCIILIRSIQTKEDYITKEDPIAKKIQQEYLKKSITIPKEPLNTSESTYPEAYAYLYCSRPEFTSDLNYFNALRLAVYKLKFINQYYDTKSKDIIITVCSYTPQSQIDLLKALDVIIVIVDPIIPSGEISEYGHYIDQFTKLHLWRLTKWERILYLDIDTTATRNVIKIWNEPEAQIRTEPSNPENAEYFPYLFAAVQDLWQRQHATKSEYFNGGVFMFQPSITYFKRLIDGMNENNIRRTFMEQDFLNEFYSPGSPHPVVHLTTEYNQFFNEESEIEPGTAVIHCKLWSNKYPHLQTYVTKWWDDFNHLFNNKPLSLERVYDLNDEFYINSTNKEAYVFLLHTEPEKLEEHSKEFKALKETLSHLQTFQKDIGVTRDMIVFTSEQTPSWQLKELQSYNALVIRMQILKEIEDNSTLSDAFVKTIFWKLAHWGRLLYIDNSISINDKQISDIWDKDSTQNISRLKQGYNMSVSNTSMEEFYSYIFPGVIESNVTSSQFNSSFFMFKPSMAYYQNLMKVFNTELTRAGKSPISDAKVFKVEKIWTLMKDNGNNKDLKNNY